MPKLDISLDPFVSFTFVRSPLVMHSLAYKHVVVNQFWTGRFVLSLSVVEFGGSSEQVSCTVYNILNLQLFTVSGSLRNNWKPKGQNCCV